MPKLTALALSSALAGLMLAAPLAHAGADPTGVWLDDTGRGAIEIAPCAKGLCGHVVWVKDNTDTKKGCGKQIIGDVKQVGGGRWDNGWIYSPEKRRNYDVELKPMDNGNLRVTGYAGMKFLSKTMIWKPAPADLQRCSKVEAKSAPIALAPVVNVAKTEAAPAAPEAPKVETAAKPADPIAAPSAGAPKATENPAPVATEPAPAPQPEPQQEASNETSSSDGDDEGGSSGGLGGALGGLKLSDLEKVLSRGKNGKCKLDLPWVKVQFNCDGGE